MTAERFIHHVAVEQPDPAETVIGARERLRDRFPRTALRRMTHLGLMLGSTLDGARLGPEDALVYASTFAETRALEDYLNGFPAASPLLFQTSIHPGGIQQVLIGRQQSLARLWPMAGRDRLVEHALLTALLEPAARAAVAGGEERGTWMLDHQMAADRPFAFALVLTRESAGALGQVRFETADAGEGNGPSLEEFARGLADRRAMVWTGGGGAWSLDWR
ncbi:MAG TPA: hypothetical protein VHD32_13455 [Candidatus Didemnitutus sp.]|nr:hypothetical protein [Candidatus Didemnitutus sp.]